MKIVLIGFMGSGKSKIGRILASRLGWIHHDTDEMISKQVGSAVGDIIRSQGEAAFRAVEKQAVALVTLSDRCVISTGGGVPLELDNMRQLSQNAAVIWLKISPETALKRAGNLKSRPLIDPNQPLESIRKRMQEREPIYRKAAQHVIEADEMRPEEVVEKILSLLPERSQ